MDGILSHIEESLEAKNIFERKRKKNQIQSSWNITLSLWAFLKKMQNSDFLF